MNWLQIVTLVIQALTLLFLVFTMTNLGSIQLALKSVRQSNSLAAIEIRLEAIEKKLRGEDF